MSGSLVASRGALFWTIIVGASLLNVGNPLRIQFGIPGFQADFSTSFGIGGSAGSSDGRGIITRSSDDFGRAGAWAGAEQLPPLSALRSGAWGSGFLAEGALDFPAAPAAPRGRGRGRGRGWPGAPAGQGVEPSEVEGGGALRLDAAGDGEDGAGFASWAQAAQPDNPVSGDGGGGQAINILGGGEGIKFTMFTRQSSSEERVSARDTSTLQESTFNPRRKTKIVIHGFYSNQNPGSGGDFIKDAFLRVADVNVILVDWGAADVRVYPLTVKRVVPMVGAEVAALIKALVEHRHADEDDFHIIGHSLGSHIAAVAGRLALGPNKGWITGLDPAGPMFEGKDPMVRLDETDASFVEAVHTDAGFLGYLPPLGHVDYYVDGGMHKHPDCGIDLLGLCSHCFAFEVLERAITNSNSIAGVRCDLGRIRRGECPQDGEKVYLGIRPYDKRRRGSVFVDAAGMGLRPSENLQAAGTFRNFIPSVFGAVTALSRSGPPGGLRC